MHAQEVIESHPHIYPPQKVRFNELKKIDDKWCYYYKDTVEYYFLFTGQAEEKNRNGELLRQEHYEKGILTYSREWYNSDRQISLETKSIISYDEFPSSYSFDHYNRNGSRIKFGEFKNGLKIGCWLESGKTMKKGSLSEEGMYGYESHQREGVWERTIKVKSDSIRIKRVYDVYENGSIIEYEPKKSNPVGVYRNNRTKDTLSGFYFHSNSLFESVRFVYHKFYPDSIIDVGYSYGKWQFNREKGTVKIGYTDWGKVYIQDLPAYMMLVQIGMEPKSTEYAEGSYVIRSERLYPNSSCVCAGCGTIFVSRISTFEQ